MTEASVPRVRFQRDVIDHDLDRIEVLSHEPPSTSSTRMVS